jgi:transcriptional regulator of acetoin/glycerol metabolism
VRARDLPAEIVEATATPAVGTLREAEFGAIRRALKATRGNKTRAARLLGINRATLYAKLKDAPE